MEFSKPLHDVEVKEKESARFECEVSREDVKVSSSSVCLWTEVRSVAKTLSLFMPCRSAGIKMEVKSEKERNMKLLLKAANTSSSSTSLCLMMKLNTNVTQRPPNPPAC